MTRSFDSSGKPVKQRAQGWLAENRVVCRGLGRRDHRNLGISVMWTNC